MSEVIKRIQELIAYLDISEREFCRRVGMSYGYMSKVKDVGASKLTNILIAYPNISADWLLLGKGSMLRDLGNSKPDHSQNNQEEVSLLRKECNDKGNRIIELMEEVERLKNA